MIWYLIMIRCLLTHVLRLERITDCEPLLCCYRLQWAFASDFPRASHQRQHLHSRAVKIPLCTSYDMLCKRYEAPSVTDECTSFDMPWWWLVSAQEFYSHMTCGLASSWLAWASRMGTDIDLSFVRSSYCFEKYDKIWLMKRVSMNFIILCWAVIWGRWQL